MLLTHKPQKLREGKVATVDFAAERFTKMESDVEHIYTAKSFWVFPALRNLSAGCFPLNSVPVLKEQPPLVLWFGCDGWGDMYSDGRVYMEEPSLPAVCLYMQIQWSHRDE